MPKNIQQAFYSEQIDLSLAQEIRELLTVGILNNSTVE